MILVTKLTTGEELIGTVVEDGEKVIIKKPCYLQMVPSQARPEQPMMALVPYAPYVEDHSVSVTKASVVWQEKPIKELYNQYNSVFGSGLVVPS